MRTGKRTAISRPPGRLNVKTVPHANFRKLSGNPVNGELRDNHHLNNSSHDAHRAGGV